MAELTWLSTDVWDDIAKGHIKHTRSINGDVILSCDWSSIDMNKKSRE